jgi:hypothetical protein
MKTRTFWVITLLLFSGMACSSLTTPNPSDNTNIPTGENETVFQQCEKGWAIQPVAVYQYPIDATNNLIIVELGVINDSKYWGILDSYISGPDTAEITLTTEDGSSYDTQGYEKGGVYNIPLTPKSIYSGNQYNGFQDTNIDTNWIAPGSIDVGYAWSNSEQDQYHFHYAFKVPNSQRHFKLELSNITLTCYLGVQKSADGRTVHASQSGLLPIINLDIEKDVKPIKASVITQSYLIGKQILNDSLDLSFTNIQRDVGSITIQYSLINKSNTLQGAVLHPYLLGEDGLQRFIDISRCSEVNECFHDENGANLLHLGVEANNVLNREMSFNVPSNLNNLSFILLAGGDRTVPETVGIFKLTQ